MTLRFAVPLLLFAIAPFLHAGAPAPAGALYEIWTDIAGTAPGDLTDDEKYREPADRIELLDQTEAAIGLENSRARLSCLLEPPATGEYTFFIASDDAGELQLSTDPTPANLRPIARVEGYTGQRQWDHEPGQRSQPILLEKGKLYYLRAFHSQGGGADHLSLAWQSKHLQSRQDRKRKRPLKPHIIAKRYLSTGNLSPDALAKLQASRALGEIGDANLPALRRAIVHLAEHYPAEYPDGPERLAALSRWEQDLPDLRRRAAAGDPDAIGRVCAFLAFRRDALLANPLLDFNRILLIRRRGNIRLPANWQGNSSMGPKGLNEICTLDYRDPNAPLATVFKPERDVFVGDVDLHFDAGKMLFSSIGTHNRWQIFECNIDGTALRQVTRGLHPDVDNYDPVYLPDDRIIYDSSANFQGVPCVGGRDHVANLHIMNADGTGIRRLCFDQDNDWCPTMLPNGRVLYLRWEYTDSAHYFSRVLMHMNPDGTNQVEFYGSNSYWPNSLFYARPVPNSSTKFVGIVSGHHGVRRMGELVLFDIARGRKEDSGAIQRIPGWGKPVKGPILDRLVDRSTPKFLHPYPLSDKFFLTAMQPPKRPWGIYLVDVFDNLLLLHEEPEAHLLEPLPLRKTPRPPVIPDRIIPDSKTATAYIQDITFGPGLANVPRGHVKQLRIFQYEYSYRKTGGHYVIGMEGPWDVRRIIGTVPVNPDGSAIFTIPANTPIALQPLDSEGKALQQMRSWFVGMPGEVVSCVGCHEDQNSTAHPKANTARSYRPVKPTPWYGPKRGFSFVREVQPVLDKYCAGCHNADTPDRPNLADCTLINASAQSRLPKSYVALHPYVRRNGPEGDYSLLTPGEFHADTSLLVQMLQKNHYNVTLDAEAWDRIITWIDLNVPAHGTWTEARGTVPENYAQRRYELKKRYASVDEDIEAIPEDTGPRPAFVPPPPMPPRPAPVTIPQWPLSSAEAAAARDALDQPQIAIDLGEDVAVTLHRIPAGTFVIGDRNGCPDEYPQTPVTIEKPFWIGTTEISLAQYRRFRPDHRNGYYDMHYKDQVKPGYNMDTSPDLPAIRVSFDDAVAFCRWLSERSGRTIALPTEAQWEWAARAGTATPFFYGGRDTDFALFANLADAQISKLAVIGVNPKPIRNPNRFWDFELKDRRFDDGTIHLAPVEQYKPNPWGLKNMIGNVAEWTDSPYRPYPYRADDDHQASRRVVRGGSWQDRPREATASFRLPYPRWQCVFDVGFRIVCLDHPTPPATK